MSRRKRRWFRCVQADTVQSAWVILAAVMGPPMVSVRDERGQVLGEFRAERDVNVGDPLVSPDESGLLTRWFTVVEATETITLTSWSVDVVARRDDVDGSA